MSENLPEVVSDVLLPHPPKIMGVAVSGGSDSMALLQVLHEFCLIHEIDLHAVTVDHRLREEAAQEAEHVARHCAKIGVSHDTLVWDDWTGTGNVQNAAREARYSKMAAWAAQHGIDTIAVGHTADDQAETVLMRLARRSGVDGLAGMQHRTLRHGINWVRPLLRSRRADLRRFLNSRNITWVDDPSNKDSRYDRIKVRKMLELLAPLGLDTDALGEVAEHMAQARKALDWHTFLAAKQIVNIRQGAVTLDEKALRLQPDEVQRRLLIKALNWISGSTYAPRRSSIASARAALCKGQAATLDGCHIRRIATRLWIFREHNALRGCESATDTVWDNRWRLAPSGPARHKAELRIRALGQSGLDQCPDWRDTGIPHVVLQSTPGVWKGDILIAAPVAGYPQNWHADFGEGPDTFFAALLSH